MASKVNTLHSRQTQSKIIATKMSQTDLNFDPVQFGQCESPKVFALGLLRRVFAAQNDIEECHFRINANAQADTFALLFCIYVYVFVVCDFVSSSFRC